MSKLPFTISEDAVMTKTAYLSNARRRVTDVEPGPSRLRTALVYGVVALGVAAATFYVTPVFAQGSMAPEVRVIVVNPSPSIVRLGQAASDAKTREFRAREQIKQNHRLQLEEQKFLHRRMLEADKAYYKKLTDQRKRR
jgi:hypothetical protein